MRILFNKSGFTGKQPANGRNIAEKPVSFLEDGFFKFMLTANTEDSREALRSLLSACIRREISHVQIANNDLISKNDEAKKSRIDVHVTFNDGEAADLEMQMSRTNDDLKTRAAYYAAQLLANQPGRGKKYREIKRVYQIFFYDFELFAGSSKMPRRYFFMEETEHDRLTHVSEIIFYELPKMEKHVNNIINGKENIKNLPKDIKWCLYFKYRHEKWARSLIKNLCIEEEGIMCAEKSTYKMSRSYRKFANNLSKMKYELDHQFDIEDAREEAKTVGIAEGRAEGIIAGRAEGVQDERKRILDLLDQGLTVEELKKRL